MQKSERTEEAGKKYDIRRKRDIWEILGYLEIRKNDDILKKIGHLENSVHVNVDIRSHLKAHIRGHIQGHIRSRSKGLPRSHQSPRSELNLKSCSKFVKFQKIRVRDIIKHRGCKISDADLDINILGSKYTQKAYNRFK